MADSPHHTLRGRGTMELQARGKAGKKEGGSRDHRDLDTDIAGAVRAPAASVLAPANLERVPTTAPPSDPLTVSQIKVAGLYFFLWFTLNIGYNITNKKALNAIYLPWSIAAVQLVVGSIFVVPLWIFKTRDAPSLTMANVKDLSPIAACHMLAHVHSFIGFEAGAGSLVMAVKAAEPLFTALLSAIFLKQIFSPLVYVALVPVVAGVALTSLRELDFKWAALGGALGANLAASTGAILSKRSMSMDVGKNMSPANLYAVVHIMAAAMLLPLAAITEGPKVQDLWTSTVTSPEQSHEIVFNTVASGVFFYLYNEVAFRCLAVVHPVTHAVGSSFKRVFMLATTLIVFKYCLSALKAVGSSMVIGGVLLYDFAMKRAHPDLYTDTVGAEGDTAAFVPALAGPIGSDMMVVGINVFLWFILYFGCTFSNMDHLKKGDRPWSIVAVQPIIGSIIVLHLWMFRLRPAPRLTAKDVRAIAPIAVWHTLSHVCAAIGLAAGRSAYFFHFIGAIFATEPLFATVFSTIFLKQASPPLVYVTTFVLAAGGIGLVLANLDGHPYLPLDSPWVAVCGALGFNIAASMCSILSKRSMGMDIGGNMSPANLYAVVNIMAAAMFLPLAIIMECSGTMNLLMGIAHSLVSGGEEFSIFLRNGVYFHLCNEVAFRCLGRLHPSTYTMGSAFKFIFFMIASVIAIGELELISLVARQSLIAIAGVLLCTLTAIRQEESGSL